jgi:hypothetical protein
MTDAQNTETDLWVHVRRDYQAGEPAALVAERYRISVRSLRRRAAAAGWRRCDRDIGPMADMPAWTRDGQDRQAALQARPELAAMVTANENDLFDLLVDPAPVELRRYAFNQACEAAALRRPAEAVAWMRLVQLAQRTGAGLDDESQPFREADHIRAAFLNDLAGLTASDRIRAAIKAEEEAAQAGAGAGRAPSPADAR